MCSPEDTDRLVAAVIELATRTEARAISLPVAKTDWMLDALTRFAFTTVHPSRIFEKPLAT
jgi:hypothetical protein